MGICDTDRNQGDVVLHNICDMYRYTVLGDKLDGLRLPIQRARRPLSPFCSLVRFLFPSFKYIVSRSDLRNLDHKGQIDSR